jgi:hypothetical protein
LPSPIPPLAFGMACASALRALVLRARRLHTLSAGFPRAPLGAVTLATVTARAQDEPLPATLTTHGT